MTTVLVRAPEDRVNWRSSIPFFIAHLVPLLAVFTGVSVKAVLLGLGLFWLRMFCITAGYHRYFSHRSYRLARVPQFLIAFGGTMAAQKGPLWWASNHRHHHRYSDTDLDIHSPMKGFWWSHVGWILCDKYKGYDEDAIKDFAKYPELRFLQKYDFIGPVSLALFCLAVAGWSGLVIGFFASTVLLWHATFSINSLSHVFGRRRYVTTDTSRNSALLALLTLGEGWNNNHHYHQASARQGFFWWEVDISYYVLKVGSWFRVVRDLRVPSVAVRAGARVREGHFDIGTFRAHWGRAHVAVAAMPTRARGSIDALKAGSAERLTHLTEMADREREKLEAAVTAARESADNLAKLAHRARRGINFAE